MYYLNKLMLGFANPMPVTFLLLSIAIVAGWLKWRRLTLISGISGLVWLRVWSYSPLMPDMARSLERHYPPLAVEILPMADAIVLQGGSVSKGDGEQFVSRCTGLRIVSGMRCVSGRRARRRLSTHPAQMRPMLQPFCSGHWGYKLLRK